MELRRPKPKRKVVISVNQNPSTEVVAATSSAAPTSAKVKKVARVVGAGVFTFAMFGTLALPAYAMNEPAVNDAPAAIAPQTIKVTAGPSLTPIDDIPLEVDSSVAEQEQREREVKEAEKAAEERRAQGEKAQSAAIDVPAGVGAGGIVSAALAQLGNAQDCTALVERSLRAVGFSVGDLAPAQFSAYGPTVAYIHGSTALAPGDIIMYGNAHVAIYIGNGQAVHGGWDGFTTVVAGLGTYHGLPTSVARMS